MPFVLHFLAIATPIVDLNTYKEVVQRNSSLGWIHIIIQFSQLIKTPYKNTLLPHCPAQSYNCLVQAVNIPERYCAFFSYCACFLGSPTSK